MSPMEERLGTALFSRSRDRSASGQTQLPQNAWPDQWSGAPSPQPPPPSPGLGGIGERARQVWARLGRSGPWLLWLNLILAVALIASAVGAYLLIGNPSPPVSTARTV